MHAFHLMCLFILKCWEFPQTINKMWAAESYTMLLRPLVVWLQSDGAVDILVFSFVSCLKEISKCISIVLTIYRFCLFLNVGLFRQCWNTWHGITTYAFYIISKVFWGSGCTSPKTPCDPRHQWYSAEICSSTFRAIHCVLLQWDLPAENTPETTVSTNTQSTM